MDESQFILRIQTGDPSAFRELVDQYRDKVFNIALSLLYSEEDAEDISQEVFIEIYQSIAGFKGNSQLFSWIYRISVQKSLEHIRKRNRKKRAARILSLFGKEHLVTASDHSPFYHPGVRLENKERSSILFQAIARLPENQRTAFTLHKTEHLSYADIAGIMQVSLSSVESLLFRAKQNLKRILADYYEKNER